MRLDFVPFPSFHFPAWSKSPRIFALVDAIFLLIVTVWILLSRKRHVARLGGLTWRRNQFCRGWLITGDTGSGKTTSGINQLAHQVFQNEDKWGGLCISGPARRRNGKSRKSPRNTTPGRRLRHFLDRFLTQPAEQFGGVRETIGNYLQYFLTPEVAEVFCTGESTFDFSAIDQGKIILTTHATKVSDRTALCEHIPEAALLQSCLAPFRQIQGQPRERQLAHPLG
jgi:hypothetical protein